MALTRRSEAPSAKGPSTGKWQVLITNFAGTKHDLSTLISRHRQQLGPFTSCQLTPKSVGIVQVSDEAVGKAYVNFYDGYEFKGKELAVKLVTKSGKSSSKLKGPKRVEITGLNGDFKVEQVQKALKRCLDSRLSYKVTHEDGVWAVKFSNTQDAVKATSILNGATLHLFDKDNKSEVKVTCRCKYRVPRPKSGRIFIRNLPFDFNVDELGNLVREIDSKATIDASKRSKGFAFCQFSSLEVAQNAIERLGGTILGNRRILCCLAVPKSVYDPSSLKNGKDKEALLKSESQGLEDAELEIGDDVDADAVSCDVDDGTAAYENDDDEDEDKNYKGKETSECAIFVRNLSFDSSSDDIVQLFNKYAKVVSCHLCIDVKGKSRGTAFVYFKSPKDAQKVLDLEGIALQRDAEFSTGNAGIVGAGSRRAVYKRPAGVGFSLHGRRLIVLKPINKDEAQKCKEEAAKNKSESHIKRRRLDLLQVGLLDPNSSAFKKLNAKEQAIMLGTIEENLQKAKNPNMFVNPKRLCLKNLPPSATANELLAAIAKGLVIGPNKNASSRDIYKGIKIKMPSSKGRKVLVNGEKVARKMPFCFVDFTDDATASKALDFLANNTSIYKQRAIIAGYAIEDARKLHIQQQRRQRLEQTKMQVDGNDNTLVQGKRNKKKRTYSRGKLQRIKRRKLKEAQANAAEATSLDSNVNVVD